MQTTIAQRQVSRISRTSDRYLVDLIIDGQDGFGWYERACDDLTQFAKCFVGTTLEEVAAVTAILSPRCSVKRNCEMTAEFFTTGNRPTGSMTQRWDSVREYYQFGNIGSPTALKIQNFARALSGDYSAIVCDTWIADVFGLSYGDDGLAPAPYAAIENRIRRLATRFDCHNSDIQAALWVGRRIESGIKGADEVADLSLCDFLPNVHAIG